VNKLQQIVAAYGVINILGGIMGLVMGKSTMSLIVGGAAGLLLIVFAVIAKEKPAVGFRSAGMLTTALIGFWAFRLIGLIQTGGKIVMPAMNLVLGLGVLAILAQAHFAAQKKSA
jgi:uncharacterized membrane protein (UPF0136 family)